METGLPELNRADWTVDRLGSGEKPGRGHAGRAACCCQQSFGVSIGSGDEARQHGKEGTRSGYLSTAYNLVSN